MRVYGQKVVELVRIILESVGLIVLLAWNSVLTIAVVATIVFVCKRQSSITKAFPMDEQEEPEYETEKKM